MDPNREEEALAHALVSVTVDDRDRLLGAFLPPPPRVRDLCPGHICCLQMYRNADIA